jgi:hypothetical protein
MRTRREQLAQLRRALDAALDQPSGMILRAVGIALHLVMASDDDFGGAADDDLEMQCHILARALLRQLGADAPAPLRTFALRPTLGRNSSAIIESIAYECPICRARLQAASGLRMKCNIGHVPVFLVAVVDDEDLEASE